MRRTVSQGWLPIARRAGMVMQEFDGGVEIRSPERSKGDAVRTILGELCPDATVACLGNDQTDEVAFSALSDRGLRVLVRPEWRKTIANVWLKPPAGLLVFLCNWLEACLNAQQPPLGRGYGLDHTISREESASLRAA